MSRTQPIHDRRSETGEAPRGAAPEPQLRSSLLAGYRDLTTLRYDYPLILVDGRKGKEEGEFVRSLSDVVDGVLREIAPRGAAGERLRQHILKLETRMRASAAEGARGTLCELWHLSAQALRSEADAESADTLEDSLARALKALSVDGEVVDCVDEIAPTLLTHAWARVHEQRSRTAREEIARLIAKLSDVLRVDFLKSPEAQSAQQIEQSVGAGQRSAFDFEAWSRLLDDRGRADRLPEQRRQRILGALQVLESQRFFAPPSTASESRERAEQQAPYSFVFESCTSAADAFRERQVEMADLVRAIAVAELEIENGYRESKHDAFFADFDETSLGPKDLAHFPSYLVCLRAKDCTAREIAQILELLSSGLPMKVLVESHDILAKTPLAAGGLALGAPLGAIAVALGDSYVLQAAASSLVQVRDRIREGLSHPGPALFSVFSGSAEQMPDLPAYLRAATATQSRAFPSFSYRPAPGGPWTSLFRIEDNPQPEADWPLDRLDWEDESHQRVSQDVVFTFADFAAGDRRFAQHLAPVPRSAGDESLVPLATYLELSDEQAGEKTPYVLMVDAENVLQKVAVDRVLSRVARQCQERWRRLQELCGVRTAQFEQRLEEERAAWERQRESETRGAPPEPEAREASETPDVAAEAALPADVPEEVRDPDEPFIETARCTTCDECTQRNPRMFAYDENKQAYIVDPNAGTYRDLVEAAETCQVSIIDPGKPKNPEETGLAELIERARPFRRSG